MKILSMRLILVATNVVTLVANDQPRSGSFTLARQSGKRPNPLHRSPHAPAKIGRYRLALEEDESTTDIVDEAISSVQTKSIEIQTTMRDKKPLKNISYDDAEYEKPEDRVPSSPLYAQIDLQNLATGFETFLDKKEQDPQKKQSFSQDLKKNENFTTAAVVAAQQQHESCSSQRNAAQSRRPSQSQRQPQQAWTHYGPSAPAYNPAAYPILAAAPYQPENPGALYSVLGDAQPTAPALPIRKDSVHSEQNHSTSAIQRLAYKREQSLQEKLQNLKRQLALNDKKIQEISNEDFKDSTFRPSLLHKLRIRKTDLQQQQVIRDKQIKKLTDESIQITEQITKIQHLLVSNK